MKEIPVIMSSFQKFSNIINEMMETDVFEDQNQAFLVLRASMLSIRDRIDPGESVHLGGQLTPVLRGFYYEAWDPTHEISKFKSEESFLEDVGSRLKGHKNIDLGSTVPVALKTILNNIDQGEADEVIHSLPKEIQELFS